MGLLDFFKDVNVKDKVGDFWDLIDDPVKNVLSDLNRPSGAARGALASLFDQQPNNGLDMLVEGWKHPERFQPNIQTPLPEPVNKLLDIGVVAATDPLTYVPALGIAGKAPKILRPLLTPVVENQTFGRTVAGELAVNVGARTGSEVGAKVTEGTPLEGVGGIAGGLVGGFATASKLTGRNIEPQTARMTEDQIKEEVPHIMDQIPSTVQKYVVPDPYEPNLTFDTLKDANDYIAIRKAAGEDVSNIAPKLTEVPNSASPEFQYKEQDIPIRYSGDEKVVDRGQLVFYSKEKERFAVDPKQQATTAAVVNNANLPEVQLPEPVNSILRGWPSTYFDAKTKITEALTEGNKLGQELYQNGQQVRDALDSVSEDGFTTLYRGEQRLIFEDNGNVKFVPQFLEDQIFQSMTPNPHTAAVFTRNIDNPQVNDRVIMKVKVPNDLIITRPIARDIVTKEEVLVLNPNKISDEAFTKLTGKSKSDLPVLPKAEQDTPQSSLVGAEVTPIELTKQDAGNNLVDNILQPPLEGTVLPKDTNQYYLQNPSGFVEKDTIYNSLDSALEAKAKLEASPNNVKVDGGTWTPVPAVKELPPAGEIIDSTFTQPSPRQIGDEFSKTTVIQKPYINPPIGGGAIMDKYHNILTKNGIDKKVAANLESLSPQQRKDLADMLVNEQAAHGIPEDIVRMIVQGYQKAGITDQTKIAKLNNNLRAMWATADGSWFGIQGLLTIPRLLAKGDLRDAYDVLTLPLLQMFTHKSIMPAYLKRVSESLPADFPKLNEIVDGGGGNLHLSFLKGNVDLQYTLFSKIPFLNPDEAFGAAGDIGRLSMFYNEWRRYGSGLTGDARTEMIQRIGTAVNRATGIAEHPLGGQIGSFTLFAPRFFQSQIETVLKSFSDFNSIEGALARRQLLTLIGVGSMLTLAANYVRGEDTVIDPRDPNFMRIRNVAGNDISVFGPWDSLVKLTVHLGSGDLGYARTKFGPLASLAANILTGHTFLGDPTESNPWTIAKETAQGVSDIVHGETSPSDLLHGNINMPTMSASTKEAIKGLILPFAWQDFSKEDPLSDVLNFFGVKNSPLSRSEKIDANMANLGMDYNDPLDRRQYLAEHPEYRSTASEEDVAANQYRDDIQARRQLNEQSTKDGTYTLVDFRENRKILSRELRNKLDTLFRNRDDFKADTPEKKWVQSYFALFDQAQDPVTHDIVGPKFDQLETQWVKDNGAQALDYVDRYMQIGRGEVETQYLKDMAELDKLGYFEMKKYNEDVYSLSGGMTDEQIDNYRNQVSAARSVNPDLMKKTFKQAMRIVLGGTLSDDQIDALDRAGKQSSGNVDIAALKDLRPELFQWFNPNATWSTYQEAKNAALVVPTTTLAIPALSGSR